MGNQSEASQAEESKIDQNEAKQSPILIKNKDNKVTKINPKRYDKIVNFVQGILKKPYLAKLTKSDKKIARKNTANALDYPDEIEEKAVRDKLHVCDSSSSDDENELRQDKGSPRDTPNLMDNKKY